MVGSNSRYVAERSGKEEEREGADRKGGGKGKARGQGKKTKGKERRGLNRLDFCFTRLASNKSMIGSKPSQLQDGKIPF